MTVDRQPGRVRVAVLTARQRDVLDVLMADGADDVAIGRRLGVHRKTVANHLTRIKAAAGAPTTLALVVGLFRGRIVVRAAERRSECAL